MTDLPTDADLASEFQKTHRHLFDLLSMIEQPAWCFHSPTGEVLLSNSAAATSHLLPATNWFDTIAPDDLHLVTSIADWSQLERTLNLRLKLADQLAHYTVRLRTCSASDPNQISEIAIAIASLAVENKQELEESKFARFKSLVDNLPLSVIHKDTQGACRVCESPVFSIGWCRVDGAHSWPDRRRYVCP